jgi:SAM-dependent methyltransferase
VPTDDSPRQLEYVGEELELFRLAKNWKRYLASRLRPYLTGDVLEVGAGRGANVPYLYRDDLSRWVSLEPDSQLCDFYRDEQAQRQIPADCELIQGTLETLPEEASFNSILYIDVLEHIRDDRAEFKCAFDRLRPGGHLLILCPAHGFLYSPFDDAIGHFRRYSKRMYREISNEQPVKMEYLDSVGMLASLANRFLLRQSYPRQPQVILWDRRLVRLSQIVDPLLAHRVGKSLLGVWRRAQ